jgi:micrococcal nuclease
MILGRKINYRLVGLGIFCGALFLIGVYIIYSQVVYAMSFDTSTHLSRLDAVSLQSTQPLGQSSHLQEATVVRVVDGDTIEVSIEGTLNKIRYIGVNTPETVDPRRPVECFGKEAKKMNQALVESNTVYLEPDITEVDDYNRLLRYVYVRRGDELIHVGEALIRLGFAQPMTIPPNVKMSQIYTSAVQKARAESLGLWGKCSG